MHLVSGEFVIFFLLVMSMVLSAFKWKKVLLLLFNIVFYLFAGIKGIILFAIFSIVTYIAGFIVHKNKNKVLFGLLIFIAITPLLFYKYVDFLLVDILRTSVNIGKGLSVPLGISFFTFQGVGYIIDVYKEKCKPERNFLNYFIFLSLFTCISSGPINRAESLLIQIRDYNKTIFDYDRCVAGARYVLVGLLLKVFIAGCLSTILPSKESGLALLIGSICYTVEIFSDFCGYSYIAYGLSKILGISVIQNFEKPYSSHSITEFWKRWHISLSSWLKDYIYIPLGGSRCSKIRMHFNTLVTFLVSGIWHGANMTFVVWGLLNGLIIVFEKITGFSKKSASKIIEFFKWITVLAIINTLWIFFDASSLNEAILTIKTICCNTLGDIVSIRTLGALKSTISNLGISILEFLRAAAAMLTFLIYVLLTRKIDEPIKFFESKYAIVRWLKYLIIIALVLVIGATGEEGAFIYANF